MNYTKTIIIIIVVLIVILLLFKKQGLYENFTNDEAIQNVASLYNSGMATVTNLTATNSIVTPKLQLGNKWVLSGAADTSGNNDEWLRLLAANGQYYGGIAMSKLWVGNAYNNDVGAALNDLNARLNAANANIERLKNEYVKKGPINLVATYSGAYGNPRTNNPLRISENYYLRSYPTPDGTADNLGSTISIL